MPTAIRTLAHLLAMTGLLGSLNVQAQFDEAQAVTLVEATPCHGKTVGERLKDEIQSHSRRDLGWQSFDKDGDHDLERALRVSKSMDIRYRWRLTASGSVEAVSDPAKKLCE